MTQISLGKWKKEALKARRNQTYPKSPKVDKKDKMGKHRQNN